MKKILLLMLVLSSCATNEYLVPEDELFITRRYAGQVTGYSIVPKEKVSDVQIIQVFTSMTEYDTITIYSKSFRVNIGDRVYIRRASHYGTGDRYEYYSLESDKEKYRICTFGFGDKLLTQTWY